MTNLSLDPLTGMHISVKLFKNVRNTPELRKKVVSNQLQCCFINPKFVLEPIQVIVAANKALVAESTVTKTVYTEILFNLSTSKHIGRSLQQFGINDDCKDLLVVTLCKESGNHIDLSDKILGEEVNLGSLSEICDLKAIKEVYNIGSEEEKCGKLIDSIVSRIATKDFISV